MSECFWYALAGLGVFYLAAMAIATVVAVWVWMKGADRGPR